MASRKADRSAGGVGIDWSVEDFAFDFISGPQPSRQHDQSIMHAHGESSAFRARNSAFHQAALAGNGRTKSKSHP
jgi:hypothetical protein